MSPSSFSNKTWVLQSSSRVLLDFAELIHVLWVKKASLALCISEDAFKIVRFIEESVTTRALKALEERISIFCMNDMIVISQ